jgi:hypothetical protein
VQYAGSIVALGADSCLYDMINRCLYDQPALPSTDECSAECSALTTPLQDAACRSACSRQSKATGSLGGSLDEPKLNSVLSPGHSINSLLALAINNLLTLF